MLTAITLENFKSYRQATLPLSPLTVLIGANASGKSNVIEGMRLLSWLAQGQRLSAIQYAVQSGDRVVRGTVDDLAYQRGEFFGLGVQTNSSEWNRLTMRLARRADGLHITAETLTHEGATVPLYSLDQPSGGQGTDAGVAYNNFAKGRNKPHVTCTDQAGIFTQLTSPASFEAGHKVSRERIPPVTKQLEKWLAAMLFLDPVPAEMRDYAFPSDAILQGNGGPGGFELPFERPVGIDLDAGAGPFLQGREEPLLVLVALVLDELGLVVVLGLLHRIVQVMAVEPGPMGAFREERQVARG